MKDEAVVFVIGLDDADLSGVRAALKRNVRTGCAVVEHHTVLF